MFVFFVLLSGLPSSASTSTRSSRSCHLAVAEDRLALPAQSSSLPVAPWAGSVDRVVRPLAVYPVRSKSSGTAHVCGGFGVASRPKIGRLGSVAESAPTTSLAPPRQKKACATRRRPLTGPEGGAGRGARSLKTVHDARANSDRRGPGQLLPNQVAPARTSPLPLFLSWAPWRAVPSGVRTVSGAQLVDLRQVCPQGTWSRLLRIRPRNSPRAALWLVPSRRQVAVAPQWRVQWLLTRLHGDTALALSASAQGVPVPAALLVLKTLTEATAPCMLASFAPSRGHGPLGCPGRQRPLCLAGLSCCRSLPQA